METIIDINNLSFSYGNKLILDKLCFNIHKGEIIGLLGENGSGKTTFLDCLYGFHGEEKSIRIFSTTPAMDNNIIKQRVSYIQDTPNLLDYLTAEQYILFICHLENIDFDEKRNEIINLIKTFDLFDEYKTKLIKEYSFGMKEKIQIIGELFLHKDLLMIDEPTNGLDIRMIISLKKIIKDERSERGSTLLVSSHNTQFLEDVCDRVLLFDKQRIAKDIILTRGLNLESEFLNIK